MFSVSNKTRSKHLDKVNEIIVPDVATTVGYGAEPFAMNQGAWATLAVAVGIMVVGALLGVLLIPGVVFIVLFFQQARPQRIVAVTGHQLVVLSRGSFMASPKAIIAAGPKMPVHPHVEQLTIGDTTVKLDQKEMQRIADASTAPANHVATPPSHPFVVPSV